MVGVHYKIVFLIRERSNYLTLETELDSWERSECLASSFAQCSARNPRESSRRAL